MSPTGKNASDKKTEALFNQNREGIGLAVLDASFDFRAAVNSKESAVASI